MKLPAAPTCAKINSSDAQRQSPASTQNMPAVAATPSARHAPSNFLRAPLASPSAPK